MQRSRLVKTLLSQRRLPETGWPDDAIEAFVRDCAAMDSNNFPGAWTGARPTTQGHRGMANRAPSPPRLAATISLDRMCPTHLALPFATGNAGVGEREGRIACPLVRARSLGLAHGIGRSGDVAAEQPKAAGSSLLLKVASLLATDALRCAPGRADGAGVWGSCLGCCVLSGVDGSGVDCEEPMAGRLRRSWRGKRLQ